MAAGVTKGRIYTKATGANGNRLIAPTGNSMIYGAYQAMRTTPAAAVGENKVQCLGFGSRVGIPAKASGMHSGQLVKLDGHEAVAEDYSGAVLSGLGSILGRIYKIYTRGEYMEETEVSGVGDILIVELGSR